MRLWSLHPKYIDSKGLVALWRETLLAKKVLQGKTKGYKKHPQLTRFLNTNHPLKAINNYINEIYKESKKRCYNFDKNKIGRTYNISKIPVNKNQLVYEFEWLKEKLKSRDPERYKTMKCISIKANPIFIVVKGGIEPWERIRK